MGGGAMTTPDIPTEAVEAARAEYDRSEDMALALTAAAPHIVEQATAVLRTGAEALRDEWRRREQAESLAAAAAPLDSKERLICVTDTRMCRAHADALTALLRKMEPGNGVSE